MKCPYCNNEINDRSNFCSVCGGRVKKCPVCGQGLKEDAQFCPKDGTKLSGFYESPEQRNNNKNNKNTKSMILGICTGVCVLAFAAVLLIPEAIKTNNVRNTSKKDTIESAWDLTSDKSEVTQDSDEDVVFSVDTKEEPPKDDLYLYCNEKKIGKMKDDGKNGDEEANDRIYSYTINNTDLQIDNRYFAKAETYQTGVITLYDHDEFIYIESDKSEKSNTNDKTNSDKDKNTKTSKNGKSDGGTDSDKKIKSGKASKDAFAAEVSGENILCFEKGDYDNDKIEEAFVITGQSDEWGGVPEARIYFMDSNGNVTLLEETYGIIPDEPVLDITSEKKKVFTFECSAYGSGSQTYVFGVKKGKAYELDISMKYMMFSRNTRENVEGLADGAVYEEKYAFVGFTSDFSQGYHAYIPHYFKYEKDQFIPDNDGNSDSSAGDSHNGNAKEDNDSADNTGRDIGNVKKNEHPELQAYYDYLKSDSFITGGDRSRFERIRMAVFDLYNDGVYEVAVFCSGSKSTDDFVGGLLSYKEGFGLVTTIENSKEQDDIVSYVEFVNENAGTLFMGQSRGKAVYIYKKMEGDGNISEQKTFWVCYLNNGDSHQNGWDQGTIDEYYSICSEMRSPIYVDINDQNLDTYLTGSGQKTGFDDSIQPIQ